MKKHNLCFLAAVPDDAREWLALLLTSAAPTLSESSELVAAAQLKAEALDDTAIALIREALNGSIHFGSLSDPAFDLYFDLAVLCSFTE